MSATDKNIVFDVVGTLVGYDAMFNAIESQLGERLRAQGIKPTLLGHLWIEVAEREYTYLSMSGSYIAFHKIIGQLFWRMLWKAGVEDPRAFANEDDLEVILQAYKRLEMRPGAKECVQKLRDGGFTVWALTAGDLERVGGYFKQAGIEMPPSNLKSCDSTNIGKPDPAAYKPLLEQLSASSAQLWFAAAHMWDVSAAKRTGFKGAYCTVFEREPLTELFGDMDVIADTLPEMADKVVAASK